MSDSKSVFEECVSSLGESAEDTVELLRCIASVLEQKQEQEQIVRSESSIQLINDNNSYIRPVLLVFAAALIFFMQAGFAMVCAGAVRRKNIQNTMLKNMLDVCGASVAFFAFGYAFAFGGMDRESPEKTFIGTSNFFLRDVEDLSFWLFEFAFSAASATIVAGSLAERCQMAAYLCYSFVLTGFVYPVVVHTIWSPQGVLSAHSVKPLWHSGVVDFAGSGVVHVTGGIAALFATIILGPRKGRFVDDNGKPLAKPKVIPGHSSALQMLGTFILWFGWYGFNSGNALLYELNEKTSTMASLAAANTTLSAGTAGFAALIANLWWTERTTGEALFEIKFAMNGSICGLVAIAAGCAVVEPWAAVVTGFVAGLSYLFSSRLLAHLRIDDAVDAIPVHLFGGLWGVIAVGLFASPTRLSIAYHYSTHEGLFYSWNSGHSDFTLLGVQICGLLFILGWVIFIMVPFFIFLDFLGWFRSDPLDEIVGLDTSYHGGLPLVDHMEQHSETEDRTSTSDSKSHESHKAQEYRRSPTPSTNASGASRASTNTSGSNISFENDEEHISKITGNFRQHAQGTDSNRVPSKPSNQVGTGLELKSASRARGYGAADIENNVQSLHVENGMLCKN